MLQNQGPPKGLEAVLTGEIEGQASFRFGGGLGIRIDIGATKDTRTFFLGAEVIEGIQAVGSLGAKEGQTSGLTLKSSASVGFGRAVQANASISQSGTGGKLQGQYNFAGAYGVGAAAAPIAIGYTWTWKRDR